MDGWVDVGDVDRKVVSWLGEYMCLVNWVCG